MSDDVKYLRATLGAHKRYSNDTTLPDWKRQEHADIATEIGRELRIAKARRDLARAEESLREALLDA